MTQTPETPKTTEEVAQTPPAISPNVRTRIYVACLIVNVAAFVGLGLGVIFGAITSEAAAASSAVILGGIGILSNGLAVGYRPTR